MSKCILLLAFVWFVGTGLSFIIRQIDKILEEQEK